MFPSRPAILQYNFHAVSNHLTDSIYSTCNWSRHRSFSNLFDLHPPKHNCTAMSTRNDIFTVMISSYFSPFFIECFLVRNLWNTWYSLPITPLTVRVIGVTMSCSTSTIRQLYCLFFSISFLWTIDFTDIPVGLTQSAFVTRMSEKAFWPCLQKPLLFFVVGVQILHRCTVLQQFTIEMADVVV